MTDNLEQRAREAFEALDATLKLEAIGRGKSVARTATRRFAEMLLPLLNPIESALKGQPASSGWEGAFQARVDEWLLACFGDAIARDRVERNHRFLEESLELVQACGCTAIEAHQLVDYTFGRPIGERHQEVGGVMNTLAALCLAYDLDMAEEGDREIARCWEKMDRIRAKQAAKPKHSPLPSR